MRKFRAPPGVTREGLKSGGMKFLTHLWTEQPDGFFCMSFASLVDGFPGLDVWLQKHKGQFLQLTPLPGFVADGSPYEWFFCPVAYSKTQRWKDFVLPSCWLYTDLDVQPPHELLHTPTYAWSTSPGHWQAVWLVDEYEWLDVDTLARVNKALTYECMADPSGWSLNKLLRVPGSKHLKAERKALNNGHRADSGRDRGAQGEEQQAA